MQAKYSDLISLFVHIVQQYPDRAALRDHQRSLSYFELYKYASQVSLGLRKASCKRGDRIVCISRKDVESMLCFWGILQMGGIPVMLDHEDGVPANEEKIREVKAAAIILDKARFLLTATDKITLDFQELIDLSIPAATIPDAEPVDLPEVCYILTTSGTTGKPKAVQISHGNVVHYTYSIYEKLGSPEKVNAVHASTFAADLGLTNSLVALVSGGMLRILNKTEATDPAIFNHIIDDNEISLLKITPSHLLSLMSNRQKPYRKPIHTIVLGGEKLSWETVKQIWAAGICMQLFNHYGPTETTIGAIAFKITPDYPYFGKTGSVPLGSPLGQGACFVDDAGDQVGELLITGPGVSIGYFENETENNKKFIVKERMGSPINCYRTGDICKKLDDGNYEFLYRTDRQVKVKGYRIELGEIEMALADHPAIEHVIVSLSDNQQHTSLEAYVKPIKGENLTAEVLRKWMLDRMPSYKIPSAFYFYTQAPYNSNGKIDMKALKRLCKGTTTVAVDLNASPNAHSWQALVESSWKKVLQKQEVKPADNFFETGGDSLLAIQLIGRLQRNGFNIHITDLNANPAYAGFLALEPESANHEGAAFNNKEEVQCLTFSQQQFLDQKKFSLDEYCQTILLETSVKIRIRELALALNCVLNGHASLTTAFAGSGRAVAGKDREQTGLELKTAILHHRFPIITQVQEAAGSLLKGIDIETGKLFAAYVFVDPGGKDYLFLACHHLCVDVISWHIILDELLDYYDQILQGHHPVATPENTVQLFYSALPQITIAHAHNSESPLEGTYKLPGSDRKEGQGETHSMIMPEIVASALKKIDEEDQSSLFSGYLLSALADAVLSVSNLPAISIDVEFHGRPQHEALPDLSRSVAWWATSMPVNFHKGETSPQHCAALVEKKTILANSLNMAMSGRNSQLSTRPDLRFNYLGRFPAQFGNSSIQLVPSGFNPGLTRSKAALQEYALNCTARFIGDTLVIDFHSQLKYAGKIAEQFFTNLMRHLAIPGAPVFPVALLSGESNLAAIGQPLHRTQNKYNVDEHALNKTIFLTGCTGFMGSYLLRELLKHQVTVYCLIRGSSQAQIEQRLEENWRYYFGNDPLNKGKLKLITGDLLTEELGMGTVAYNNIAEEADLIIHAAADINLLKNYTELFETNISATANIIRLAQIGKKKKLHYISTLAVSGCSTDIVPKLFSEEDLDYGQSFISDYEKTKFEAEKMIRAFLDAGHEGKIYRVGHLAADSVQGRFQRNIGENRIFQVLKGIMLLKQVPDLYQESTAFSYVDIVAKGIIRCVMDQVNTSMKCLHMENPQSLSFRSIVDLLCRAGYEINIVELEEFKQTVNNFEGEQTDRSVVNLADSWIQRSLDYPRRVHYSHRNSTDLLARSGLYFPATTPEWFSSLIREGVDAGYFLSPADIRAKQLLLKAGMA